MVSIIPRVAKNGIAGQRSADQLDCLLRVNRHQLHFVYVWLVVK